MFDEVQTTHLIAGTLDTRPVISRRLQMARWGGRRLATLEGHERLATTRTSLKLGHMPEEPPTEAVIMLDAAGRYVDANDAALRLLGVSLDDLRTSQPDRFAVRPMGDAEQAALRARWESGGTQPVVGTTGLRRPDGTVIRVAYAIQAVVDGARARIWQVEGSPNAPTTLFTVGDVLREWRAAERELAELAPGTPEWARTLDEITMLRGQYQELFRALKPEPESA
jgi:PAS domain S-box-containing protein